jgi:hypothetical protein
MCGLCGKDALQTEAWVELEVFVEVERELELAEPMCADCARSIRALVLELPLAA